VRVLQCINNLRNYAGDSMVADGTTDARQIQIELPGEERYPGPPGWELGLQHPPPPHTHTATKKKKKTKTPQHTNQKTTPDRRGQK